MGRTEAEGLLDETLARAGDPSRSLDLLSSGLGQRRPPGLLPDQQEGVHSAHLPPWAAHGWVMVLGRSSHTPAPLQGEDWSRAATEPGTAPRGGVPGLGWDQAGRQKGAGHRRPGKGHLGGRCPPCIPHTVARS